MSNKKYSWWQVLLNQPALDRAYDKIDRLEFRIDIIEQEVKNKQYMIEALDIDMETLKDEAISLQQDILFWHDMFESALAVPDIKADIKDKEVRINIYDDAPNDTFQGLYVNRVDLHMQLYPYDTWVIILAKIQEEIKEEIGRWRTDVSDCDDFATIMRSALSLAHIDARARQQGAFAWVRSRNHAYNAFIDTDWVVWLYEPQTGEIKGKLGEVLDDDGLYISTHLRF